MYPWLVTGVAVLFAFEKRLWIPNVVAAIAFILSLVPPLVAAHLAKRKAAAAKKEEAAVPAGWEVGKGGRGGGGGGWACVLGAWRRG